MISGQGWVGSGQVVRLGWVESGGPVGSVGRLVRWSGGQGRLGQVRLLGGWVWFGQMVGLVFIILSFKFHKNMTCFS